MQSKSLLKFTETFHSPKFHCGGRICDVCYLTVPLILAICTHYISSVRTAPRKQAINPRRPFYGGVQEMMKKPFTLIMES